MTVSTALVFIQSAAPSAAQSRSDIGIDKANVPMFIPAINHFQNNWWNESVSEAAGLGALLGSAVEFLIEGEPSDPEGAGVNRCLIK